MKMVETAILQIGQTKQTHQPQISTSISFVPVSEEFQKIMSTSIKRIMIAALQRHANHALKETDLCSEDSEGTVSSESSTS